jgi:hypothetical protein
MIEQRSSGIMEWWNNGRRRKAYFPSILHSSKILSLHFLWKAFKGAVDSLVAGPAASVKFSGYVQVFRVVAFMDADRFLKPVGNEKGLQAAAPLSGLGDSTVAIILTERIVPH